MLKSQNRRLKFQTKHSMCSSVWSWLSSVFSWKFACYLHPLQHNSTLKKTFHPKVFFEIWNGNEKPIKNLRKESWERTSGTTKWDKLGQVGVCGTSGTRRRGSSDLSFFLSLFLKILVGQVGPGEGGLQIIVGQMGQGQGGCPLVPFHLSKGLQGRELVQVVPCSCFRNLLGKPSLKVGLGILQITSEKRCPRVWPCFGRSLFSTDFVEFDPAV